MSSEKLEFSHLDEFGNARMVDIGAKPSTVREALAEGQIRMGAETLQQLIAGELPKGDVLTVARIAGIQAAKRCSELIPLCHPLALTAVDIHFNPDREQGCLQIFASCRLNGRTGVEMEALTAVSVAALCVYDMCKAVDKSMVIGEILLREKRGGRSGDWRRSD